MAGPAPLIGTDPRRLGRYELLGRLGSGGQSVVYLGRPLGREDDHVAIKLLRARLLGDDRARSRFVRELALLQRVAGFCTAQMREADMDGDRPYIVSEFVPGPSLRHLVRDRGPRTGADLDRLAIGAATALTAIHRAGVVHRDFKPHNVLMGPDGPRVIDFGVARALDAGTTLTGEVVGTPAYMAPEQFTGGAAGPPADLFAWAATLLFAATARDPFAGGPLPAVMYRIMYETPDLGPLPPRLAEVAAACLTKDPRSRPTSGEALMWLLDGPRTTPPTPTPPTPTPVTPALRPPVTAPASFVPGSSAPGSFVPILSARDASGSGLPAPGVFAPQVEVPQQGVVRASTPVRRRALGRGAGVRGGLVLAGGLAVLDVAALAILIARPELSHGPRGALLLATGASFVLPAVVTLVAVVLAWKGSRAAAWTVLGTRALRVALWSGWSLIVTVQTSALALHAALSALVVALLAEGLRARAR